MKNFFLIFGNALAVPTAIFHGLNDKCESNQVLTDMIAEETNDFALCIEIGEGAKTTWLKDVPW